MSGANVNSQEQIPTMIVIDICIRERERERERSRHAFITMKLQNKSINALNIVTF